jgi:hypothetical protein
MEQLYRILILFIPFFGPQIALAYRLVATPQGLKTLDFQGLTPTCPRNGYCPHQKSYARAQKDGEIFLLSGLNFLINCIFVFSVWGIAGLWHTRSVSKY